MVRNWNKYGLLLMVLGTLVIARPASADINIDLNPVTFAGARDLVRAIQNQGLFKCPVAATLINLLNAAEATSDPGQRYQILQQAFLCCDVRSREINPATGQPWVSFPGVPTPGPDRADFLHTATAQNVGDCLCKAIACLRDGQACHVIVQVVGSSSTCSFGLL